MEKLRLKIEEASAAIGRAEQEVFELLKETFAGREVTLKEPVLVTVRSESYAYVPIGVYVEKIKGMEDFQYPYMVYTAYDGEEFPFEDIPWSCNIEILEAYLETLQEKNPIPFPIDNKHLLEDFTDDFHEGEFVEYVDKSKITHQTFWMNGCACSLSYKFGQNWVKFNVLSGLEDARKLTMRDVDEIIESYRETLHVEVTQEGWLKLMKFFKEEE